ncbi:DUF6387 family protein [Photorhabdus sp. CRCIA-P01]|uniref:DUF6387 family protein n=1 Tax=Photorhabdus sp. CRCIA-P01 TaxID=2019570 RepID=UPI000E59C37F|nr:DUF6387 family protein [Photorhabdus sp. CRCIA-P01]
MLMDEYYCLNWFDIEKYEKYVHSLNHEQWFLALQIRHEYWNFPAKIKELRSFYKENNYKSDIIDDKVEKYNQFINDIEIKTVLSLDYLNSNKEFLREYMELPLHTMSDVDLQLAAHQHSIGDLSSDEFIHKVLIEKDENYVNDNVLIYKGTEDSRPEWYLSVNLAAKDDVLYQAFKQFLAEERRKKKIFPRKDISEAEIKKFINLRLLQYLDLIIYCSAKNIVISNVVFAQILYPDIYDTNPIDRLRKTMPSLAKEVMEGDWLVASELKLSLVNRVK